MFNHTFYINDTDGYDGRASAKSKIEDIINKAYTQEMNSLAEVFKILQMNKKPKVFCLYHEKKNNEVVIDNVQLEAIKGHK